MGNPQEITEQKSIFPPDDFEGLSQQELAQVANDDEFMEEMRSRIERLEKEREAAKLKFTDLSSL